MITKQPTKSDFSLSIINAHEFQPHPQINQLVPLDTLLVVEQKNRANPFGTMAIQNSYHIASIDGRTLYWAIESNSQHSFALWSHLLTRKT
jgi:hypothetical protein